MEETREEFVTWFQQECGYRPNRYRDGRYVTEAARLAWASWQAALKAKEPNNG